MKYSYTVYFTPDKDGIHCDISVPVLETDYRVEAKPYSQEEIEKAAIRELGMTIYAMGLGGSEVPQEYQPPTMDISIGTYSKILTVDTEETAKHIVRVKEIELT